ncbi:WxL domain-containing protein [Catellatospora sp. NPDC049609]|uniref:WxL domain-containing protein n=1 Tax=Catellatospora sp. NPDC049609 TaxID=3155505 RepID=UPI0034488B7D
MRSKWAVVTSSIAAVAALGLIQAPAQAYGPTANSLGCRLYFGDSGTGSSPTTWADTFGLTLSPVTPAPGQTVTVTLTAAAGPDNGPAPLVAGDVPVIVKVALGGSQSGTVTLNMAPYPTGARDPYTPLGAITASGTFVAGAAGTATATVTQVKFANTTAATYCSNAGDRDHKAAPQASTIVESFTVFDGSATVTAVSGQTVTTHARAGNVVSFSVSGLAPNATLTASLKDAAGGGTGQGTGTGSTTATGTGTGTLTVPADATTGVRSLAVSDGVNTVLAPITVLGAPTIAINPGGGGAGTSVAVTGTNWNPGSTVAIRGYQALAGPPPPSPTGDAPVSITASAAGGISTTYTVNAPATAFIGASSGIGPGTLFAIATWTASADACVAKSGAATTGSCALTYNLSQTVTAGNLAMARGAGSGNIALSGVTLDGTVHTSTGTLPVITVTDFRGSTFGWSLVGTLTDFTGTPGGTIPKANLSWTPTCTATAGAGNAVTAAAGTAGQVDGATLCSAPADAAGTGGSFDASAALALTVPANQLAGSYSATLTITLS